MQKRLYGTTRYICSHTLLYGANTSTDMGSNTSEFAPCNTDYTAIFDMHILCMFSRPGIWRVASVADAVGRTSELSPYNTAYTAIFNMNILKPYVLTQWYMASRHSGGCGVRISSIQYRFYGTIQYVCSHTLVYMAPTHRRI